MATNEEFTLVGGVRGEGGGGRLPLESMVAVDVTNLRPDIEYATRTPAQVKANLTYKDMDELETGMQKVQPLPFLDEEIEKYHEQIAKSVPGAKEVQDAIPGAVLDKVEQVIKMAHDGQTSLFKASQLLETTSDAYQYSRFASRNKFDLQRASKCGLDNYDTTFTQLIAARIKTDMQDAEERQKHCFVHLESAMATAHKDVQAEEQRESHEGAMVSEDGLEDIHEQVRDMIKMERSELELIRDQCTGDMVTVAKELHQLDSKMQSAQKDYKHEESQRLKRLKDNLDHQQRLEEQLRRLKAEQNQMQSDSETGKRLQEAAEKAHEEATQEVLEWRAKIEELKRRTDTSLQIMDHMSECTDWIVEDAKTRKRQWREKLSGLKLEGLLTLRDCLIASGCMHLTLSNDCSKNLKCIAQSLTDQEKEKKKAAKTGFKKKVTDIEKSIQSDKEEETRYEEELQNHLAEEAVLSEELAELDAKIYTLRPDLKLDDLKERFERHRQLMDQAFGAESVTGVPFTSHGLYNV